MDDIEINQNLYGAEAIRSLDRDAFPSNIKELLLALKPVLINRYNRQYFLSRDGSVRATLDCNIQYSTISEFINNRKPHFVNKSNYVLEIKYLVDCEYKARDIGNRLAHRVSRNSKYVNGINVLNYSGI